MLLRLRRDLPRHKIEMDTASVLGLDGSRLEAGRELKPRTVAAISAALEAAGVVFAEENGEGPGVRLRKARR